MGQLTYRLGNGVSGTVGADYAERLLQNSLYDTEELREDNPASFLAAFSYRGLAASGSATSSAVWNVIRTTYDNNGNRSRVQVRLNIVWDNRTSGWAA